MSVPINAPCKGCGNRTPGCHSSCEKYIIFHQQREAIMARKQKEREIETFLIGVKDTLHKEKRKERYHGGGK